MKILIAITNLNIGGAQTLLVRVAKELSATHSVYVYNFNLFHSDHQAQIVDSFPRDVKIFSSPFPNLVQRLVRQIDKSLFKNGFVNQFLERLIIIHFKAIIALLKINIVNSHLYHADSLVIKALQNSSIPIVITDHGDYRYVMQNNIAKSEDIFKIFNRVNAVIYISDSNLDSLRKYISNSQLIIKKIYNGLLEPIKKNTCISKRQKLEIPENSIVFGMVARGIPEKGWAEALQAFTIAQSMSEKPIYLIMVGESNHLEDLKKSLDHKISACVFFVGYSLEPEDWIESFDVGLLPTYFAGESLPNSIIEYLSLGKPAIATEVAGIPEMINYQGQLAGFLVKLDQQGKADIPSMVNAMLKYSQEPEILQEHSLLAKQAFHKFRIQTCIESYESLFQEVLSTST